MLRVDCSETALKGNPVHPLFTDENADVTFQSSDGVQFQVQRKFLEANTGAFPGAEFDTRGEVTPLTESAAVLEVLFQFVYPRRFPDIEGLEFEKLAEVAEAAEKYEVFFAIEITRVQLRRCLPEHAMEILTHATRHDCSKLIQEAVPHLVRSRMSTIADMLPNRYLPSWIHYHEGWQSIFDDALTSILSLNIVTRASGSKSYFTSSQNPEVCHSCTISMIRSIQDLKAIQPIVELKEALSKPHPPLSACRSNSCQYTTALSRELLGIKTKIEEIKFVVPSQK